MINNKYFSQKWLMYFYKSYPYVAYTIDKNKLKNINGIRLTPKLKLLITDILESEKDD
jgi:hypothetical protein